MLLVLRHEPNVRLATIDENGECWPGCAAAQAATNKRLATSWAWCGKGQPFVTE